MKSIFKVILLIAVIAISKHISAQQWTNNIKSENPTFYDIQKAFNDYWEPLNVENGKYKVNGVEHKAYGWKQFKRWEWYWQQRVGESGKFPKNTIIWDEWEKLKVNKTTNVNNKKPPSNWSPIGPYDETVYGLGRVNCMAFHPTNSNIFWVGTPAGGLWKTTNGGSSWTPIGDNLPVLGVSSIAIDPSNPNIMYIATGDGEGAFSLFAFGNALAGDTKSVGILKSTDGGNTWTNVLSAQQFEGFLIRKLVIDPNYPTYLFAATNWGIFRTDDGGTTWSLPQLGYFMDIEFNPGNTDIMYASTFDNIGGDAQVYVTTDIGVTWTQTTSFTGINRINIAVTPNSVNAVDLLCSRKTGNPTTDNSLFGLYYSVNSGSSWTMYYDGTLAGQNLLGNIDDGTASGGQGFYDLAYVIDPNDWNTIILGGVNTFKTTDGGGTWSPSNVWTTSSTYNTTGNTQIVHADKHFFAYHPLVANTLFECNDGGIYKSTDNGNTWTDITNGMQISQFYSISSSQIQPTVISGGRQDNGSFISDGVNEYSLTGGDGMITHLDYSDTNYFYTSLQYGDIIRFIISPPDTFNIADNISGTPVGEWLTPYQIDPTTPTILYAGYDEVYKSTNRGNTWSPISSFGFPVNSRMRYLAVAPTNSNYIYAARLNDIYTSSNGGSSWSNITGLLPVSNQFISSIKVDPTDENGLFVTFSGYVNANEKIYFTPDAGISWFNITLTGLPNLPVNCIELDKSSGDLYVGTDLGVYMLDTGLVVWSQYGTGLPNVVVTDLDIQYSSSKLKVGTFGRGIWDIDLNTPFVQAPVASFTSNFTSICETNCVNFTDNSTNTPTSWSWSFPGGTPSSSTQQNPTNICYPNSGTYNVTLTATNSGGSDILTMTNYINVNSLPTTANVTGVAAPCESTSQTYTATSTGATSYIWSLPVGWTGSSASNTINVTVGNSSGSICATPVNSCGNGTQGCQSATVSLLPTTASVSGNLAPNQGASETYTASSTGATSYIWSLPAGWTGSSTTSTINVTVGSTSGNVCATPVNSCGNGAQGCQAISIITGIDEVASLKDIVIYPNPNDGSFNINIADISTLKEVRIVDALGKVVFKENTKSNNYFIKNIASGLYSVIIEFEEQTVHKKIIVN
ncbi:MAG: hypothetical protein COB15_16100 [Flavobacteriales bacterium]|nr:MAG: hypothetical protein COB15_16100 [Flavobacteriales bacterium]